MPAAKGGLEAIAPYGYAWAVTPSDSADLSSETRAIYVGGAGAVACQMYDAATNKLASVTFAAVPVGTTLEIKTSRVLSTGTTATNLVALA